MKTVTLTQDMRPWRDGDDIHVDDKLARSLVENGEAKDLRPFNPAGEKYEDRSMRAGGGKQGYKTKGSQA
ncbi:hypothetical protein [Rhizobium sp. N324]|uniref:hypothetical protein n=1 Tax=Rhizobium sp. N324 TaxID=1703969 RepID=UPI0007EA8283|nr:hypothetical protein [Rhizobium sp. N324]ANM12052.1 hypothetical protein AMK05_CH03703 [Rhizobium sp. N324]